MATTIKLTVNGKAVVLKADDPSMPLLYALRDQLGLHGMHFGCGLAQCGACTVHYYGEALRSCVMPVSAVADAEIVTLEGLGTAEKPHPVQQAFIDEQAAQCGYCINGMIMQAAAFPRDNKAPDRGPGPTGAGGQPVQMRHPRPDPARRHARRRENGVSSAESAARARFLAALFLKRGGALVVTFALASRSDRSASCGAAGRQERLADEVGGFIAIDAKGQGHDLFRQGRARNRRGHRDRPDRRRRTVGVTRSRDNDPGRYPAHAQSGTDLRQLYDTERRHADPARGGDRARGACCNRLQTISSVAKDTLAVRDGVVTSRDGGKSFRMRNWSASESSR